MARKFLSKKPAFEYIRKKWKARQKGAQEKFWEKHGNYLKQMALGSLGGLMLFSPSTSTLPAPKLLAESDDVVNNLDRNIFLANQLRDILPDHVRPLERNEEEKIIELLSLNFGFNIKGELEGIRLNRNYGLIGGEQHLYRYPGDNLYAHADNALDWAKYGSAGIAPGLGAWGYFAPSKQDFREIDKTRERYYLAIQTFLSPGFAENVGRYRDFFKFRKMLVISPQGGQAVVAVVGDAGPAEWTGKHLGGSPEVMDELGLATGMRKGPVLYFFIDDPGDKVPLGPVKAKEEA